MEGMSQSLLSRGQGHVWLLLLCTLVLCSHQTSAASIGQGRPAKQDPPPLHDALKPIAWLLGKWNTTTGYMQYPNINPMIYGENVEFYHLGSTFIQFTLNSYNLQTLAPMHSETGYLRVNAPPSRVAYMSSHNAGIAELAEGFVTGEELVLYTISLNQMSNSRPPAVLMMKRLWHTVEGGRLEQVVDMATVNTPLSEHLRATYDRSV